MKSTILLVVVLLMLLIIPFSWADKDYPSISCANCQVFFGELGYCNQNNFCSLKEKIIGEAAAEVPELEIDVRSIEENINTLTIGLAATQAELDSVEQELEKEQNFTTIIKYSILIIIALTIAILLIYLITTRKAKQSANQQKANQEIINYITQHIKGGKKYPYIRDNLQKAGWAEEEIEAAYKETMRHNYQRYKKGISSEAPTKNKIISISIISIVVLIGVFFLLRGITTGKAVEFGTSTEFKIAVETNLQRFLPASQFYPLVNSAKLCVQVKDGEKSVSFAVSKTAGGLNVVEAAIPCTEDVSYDGSLLFTNWQSFNVISRKADCENIRSQHSAGMYVLPSQYILPGFDLNPTKDHSRFCTALNVCLTAAEKVLVGC